MTASNESAHRRAPFLAGRMLAATLLAAGAALGACDRGQIVGPDRAAPDAPSLAVNPACDPGLGGQAHTADSILAPETWSRAGNPHRVDRIIHVEGAGVLILQPGVMVCFESGAALWLHHGGRLVANGLDTARIVLTGTVTVGGWWGMQMQGTPSSPSSLRNVVVEHTSTAYALAALDGHLVNIDSTVFRQNEAGVYLWARGSSIRRSRLDTLSNPYAAAVTLGGKTTFQKTVIRGAAGVGLAVLGTDSVSLLGGRIEGSGGVGLQATAIAGPGFTATQPVRVVGGASYPVELSVGAFSKIYTQTSHQDSLLGNARDTLVVVGGALTWLGIASNKIPWHVTGDITVTGWGGLNALPGASLVFDSTVSITATNGGRVVAHGTAAAPVLFTSRAIGGWDGIVLNGAPALGSALTNVRIEYVKRTYAVLAVENHTVVIDSAVFRQNGVAVVLYSANSRISRSRVDTTLIATQAVALGGENILMESTLIRGAAGIGLTLGANTVTIASCEIRDSLWEGISGAVAQVHNCNLINNGDVGIRQVWPGYAIDAEDNWWGDAAGPNGPNGDGVAGAVDYTPWRTTPFVLPYVP